MKMDWSKFKGQTLIVTLHENYGMAYNKKEDMPFYEIIFKIGKLTDIFDEGLLLETTREEKPVLIFIPYQSVKCVEILNS